MQGIFKMVAVLLACLPLLGPVQTAGADEVMPVVTFDRVGKAMNDADAGNADAQFELGKMYYVGNGVPRDYTEARRWYAKAAAQGHAKAQICLGNMHYEGNGVPRNFAEARRWWEKAATQGKAPAQYNLGVLYDAGLGVRQDKRTAKAWYGKACDGGLQDACNDYRRLNEAGF